MARKKFRSFTIGAILFLSLVAIVITGFGTGGGGLGDMGGGGATASTELAKVGSQPITADKANNQFNQDFQNLRQEMEQRNMAAPQILEYLNQGGFEGSVDRLVSVEALRQFAEARGIIITRQMIDNAISTSEEFSFARIGNNFDNGIFQRALEGARMTVDQVREIYRRRLLFRQGLNPIAAGFAMPQGVAAAHATVALEQRTGLVGLVPVDAIARGLNPSEAEIAAYYREYRDFFTAPERRVIKYALIGPEQLTVAAPTEAEIRDVYGNTPQYQQRETRTLESLNFGSSASAQADANAFVQRVRGGTAFQQAAQAAGRGEAYSRRANQTQAQFSSLVAPEVSAQAFRAQQGAIVGPVRAAGRWYVVRVEAVTTIGGRPLETVRADIVRELERRKRVNALNALVTQLELQIEERASFEDIVRDARLTVITTPPISAQGRLADGSAWPALTPEARAMLPAAFEMEADAARPQMASVQANGRWALIGIVRTEPAAPPPLTEIRDRVRAQLVRRTAVVRSYRIANAIAARINQGVPAAQALAQAGMPLPPPEAIRATRQEALSPQARLFFRLRPGTAAITAAPNNRGYYIVAPQTSMRASTAPPAGTALLLSQLSQRVGPEADWTLLKAMEERIGVQRNAAAIAAERQRISGTMAPMPAQ